MKIKWFGHSCFLITSSKNIKIVTDPFNDEVGYKVPKISSDIVTISHNHSDHNNIGMINGNYTCINKIGTFLEKNIKIKGIASYHDRLKGLIRGKNIIYKIEVDGLKVCHCGDLGYVLNSNDIEEIGKVDILTIPVGGKYTINADQAMKVIKLLKPAVTIPMHYKTEDLKFSLDSIDKFTDMYKTVNFIESAEVELTIENLDSYSDILVLKCKD